MFVIILNVSELEIESLIQELNWRLVVQRLYLQLINSDSCSFRRIRFKSNWVFTLEPL